MPAGVDIDSVPLSGIDHFGVSGDNHYSGFFCFLRDGSDDLPEIRKQEAFFQNKREAQIPGSAACHAQIIDCAADRKFSDVSSGKFPGGDNETVGGKDKFLTSVKDSAVSELGKSGIVECGKQDGIDQFGCLQSSAPIVQCDSVVHFYSLRFTSCSDRVLKRRGTCPFAGNHAWPHRIFRRADSAEKGAAVRAQNAAYDLSAAAAGDLCRRRGGRVGIFLPRPHCAYSSLIAKPLSSICPRPSSLRRPDRRLFP